MIWIVEPFLDLGRDRQEYGVEEENKESKWSLYFILFYFCILWELQKGVNCESMEVQLCLEMAPLISLPMKQSIRNRQSSLHQLAVPGHSFPSAILVSDLTVFL